MEIGEKQADLPSDEAQQMNEQPPETQFLCDLELPYEQLGQLEEQDLLCTWQASCIL
jgi:hypothetical protein